MAGETAQPVMTMPARKASRVQPTGRQCVRFLFAKLDPAWYGLPETERNAGLRELSGILEGFATGESTILRMFDLTGTRGDADMMFWCVASDLDDLYTFVHAIRRSLPGRYLSFPYSYFSMTKRSTYVENHVHEGQEGTSDRLVIHPMNRKYLFVYPFVKTREWYRLPQDERQRQMDEHIAMGHKYPSVKINTTYSFGLDDQEFVVAFESDSVADFLDLVHEMRASEASAFTIRDTPSFTCQRVELDGLLGLFA